MLIILGTGNSESDYYGNYEKETLKWLPWQKKSEQSILHCDMKGYILKPLDDLCKIHVSNSLSWINYKDF